MNVRSATVLAVSLILMASACGDDGPDQALRAERAAALAAESRAGMTVPVAPATTATPAGTAAGDDSEAMPSLPTSTTEPTAPPTGVVVTVVALDNSFRPEQLTIQVGDEVLWENNGRNEHNILNIESADEGFETDGAWGIDVEDFQPGDAFSHVFTVPGNYRYFCTIHGNTDVGMVGTIIVEA